MAFNNPFLPDSFLDLKNQSERMPQIQAEFGQVRGNMQTTYVMVKPDGVQRGLVGEIIQRFERKGLQLVGLNSVIPSEEIARSHYAVHAERPFFPGLIKFVTSGPVVCMAWKGKDAISVARNLIGPTNGREAPQELFEEIMVWI